MTHICVSEIIIIVSDNGLSPSQHQAIIWTNAGILLTGLLGTNFSEILIGIKIFSFKKMLLKMLSAKWRPFCLGLNVLKRQQVSWWYENMLRLLVSCLFIWPFGEMAVKSKLLPAVCLRTILYFMHTFLSSFIWITQNGYILMVIGTVFVYCMIHRMLQPYTQ